MSFDDGSWWGCKRAIISVLFKGYANALNHKVVYFKNLAHYRKQWELIKNADWIKICSCQYRILKGIQRDKRKTPETFMF